MEDDGLVVRGDALVDDPLDQAGDGQIHDHHRGEQGQCSQRAAPVGADEAEQVAEVGHVCVGEPGGASVARERFDRGLHGRGLGRRAGPTGSAKDQSYAPLASRNGPVREQLEGQ